MRRAPRNLKPGFADGAPIAARAGEVRLSSRHVILDSICVLRVPSWLGVALGGCAPSGRSQSSEEKEPHFVLGKSRVNAMDYQGAIEAFEQSLEANPAFGGGAF